MVRRDDRRRSLVPGDPAGAAADGPRPHGRGGLRRSRGRDAAVRALRAASPGDRTAARTGPDGDRGGECGTRPCPCRGRNRVSRCRVPLARPRSDRRRADDVRAGELGALPPQDLQRGFRDRWRRAGPEPVPHDPRHARGAAAGHDRRVRGQCRRHRRRCCGTLLSRRPWPVPDASGGNAHPDEGRDPQSPDCHRAIPGGCHRFRRGNPRRGRDGHRREAEGRPGRLHGLAPAHPRAGAALGGGRPRQARPHRLCAVDHARGADRRRSVQQRVRPSESGGLLPHVRAAGRRRVARLSQADHDRRGRRQHT